MAIFNKSIDLDLWLDCQSYQTMRRSRSAGGFLLRHNVRGAERLWAFSGSTASTMLWHIRLLPMRTPTCTIIWSCLMNNYLRTQTPSPHVNQDYTTTTGCAKSRRWLLVICQSCVWLHLECKIRRGNQNVSPWLVLKCYAEVLQMVGYSLRQTQSGVSSQGNQCQV